MVKRIRMLTLTGTKSAVWMFTALLVIGLCAEAGAQVRGSRTKLLKELDEAFVEIWNQVGPAVVNVDTEREIAIPALPPFFREFFREWGMAPREPEQRFEKRQGRGSGFVIDKNGHILTNFHVIEDADTIKVRFSEEEVYDATVVGKDRGTDIALIKIDAKKKLPAVLLGDSDTLRVGQLVMAIGNPGGTLDRTFTVGHVSGLGRALGQFRRRMPYGYRDFIQTDAAINLGNSGGPLVNVDGKVVGINTAMAAFAENIGFAVPINYAKNILSDLKEKGRVIRGFLGVEVWPIESGAGERFGLPDDTGALVVTVTAGSPAEEAGLKTYDVITEVNGQRIESPDDLVRIITGFEPGTVVRVTYVRDKKVRSGKIKLAELPESITEEEPAAVTRPEEKLGMSVQDITPDLAQRLGLETDKGVIVTDVERGGLAERRGVSPGDVILEVNRQPVENVVEFRKAVDEAEPDEWLLMLLSRDKRKLIAYIKKPAAAK